jgi:nucleotide-binding universal stress UspA family protein
MIDTSINKVLIALDYDPTSEKIAKTGYSMAKAMGAEIVLLTIYTNQAQLNPTLYDPIIGYNGFMEIDVANEENNDKQKKAAEDFLEKTKSYLGDSNIKTIVKEGDYSKTILKTANDIKADIIVLGSHSKKWLEKILLGSTTEKILKETNLPLLIVPTKKKH